MKTLHLWKLKLTCNFNDITLALLLETFNIGIFSMASALEEMIMK